MHVTAHDVAFPSANCAELLFGRAVAGQPTRGGVAQSVKHEPGYAGRPDGLSKYLVILIFAAPRSVSEYGTGWLMRCLRQFFDEPFGLTDESCGACGAVLRVVECQFAFFKIYVVPYEGGQLAGPGGGGQCDHDKGVQRRILGSLLEKRSALVGCQHLVARLAFRQLRNVQHGIGRNPAPFFAGDREHVGERGKVTVHRRSGSFELPRLVAVLQRGALRGRVAPLVMTTRKLAPHFGY